MTFDRARPLERYLISGTLILLTLTIGLVPTASAQSRMTWGLHVSLVPAWFDSGD